MLQIPLHYLIILAQLLEIFGAGKQNKNIYYNNILYYIIIYFILIYCLVLLSIAYILLVLFIGMPLYMLIILMSQYCRKGFIKFWQCVPLLKG